MTNNHIETEVRFLEVNVEALKEKLKSLGAIDKGEVMLEEVIFYDQDRGWKEAKKEMVRLRKSSKGLQLSYKNSGTEADTTEEIELHLDHNDLLKAESFLEKVGLTVSRHQQKRRHTFELDNVTIDIDSWPKIPPYVELEGSSVEDLKNMALKLGLDWNKADTTSARAVLENIYKISVGDMKWFTFDRFE